MLMNMLLYIHASRCRRLWFNPFYQDPTGSVIMQHVVNMSQVSNQKRHQDSTVRTVNHGILSRLTEVNDVQIHDLF